MTDSSTSETITHEERHRALVDRLARNLRPTKPLWPVQVRIALWVALEVAVIVYAGSMHSGRHDLRQQFASPMYLAEIISFIVAGVLAAALAFRSAIPGLEPSRAQWIVLGLVALGASLTLWAEPVRADVPLSEFIKTGVVCAAYTGFYAWLPWLVLLIAVRRGAPSGRAGAGILIGAATLFTYAVMRVDCPIDERYHLFIWHLLPA